MKKQYIKPLLEVVKVNTGHILSGSQTGDVSTTGLDGMNYSDDEASDKSADSRGSLIWED